MARIRSVKPEFWLDRSFVRKVPNRDARMLYQALWNIADEHGRLGGDPHYVKGQCFPYQEDDDLTPVVIDKLLDELAHAGKVVRYEADGDPYLFLPNLHKHQRLESGKVPSRLPPPPDPDDPGPGAKNSKPGPDSSAPSTDGSAQNSGQGCEKLSPQVHASASFDADESARDAESFAPGADESALFYVAGSRLQVAGDKSISSATASPAADAAPEAASAKKPGRPKKPKADRPDVDALCARLAGLMDERGCRTPTITDRWRDAARLLLDNDRINGKPIRFEKAMEVLEWSQVDSFWQNNIHSMPTFRAQFDKLRGKAIGKWRQAHPWDEIDDDEINLSPFAEASPAGGGATILPFQRPGMPFTEFRGQIPAPRVSATDRALAEVRSAVAEAKAEIYGSATS